MFLAEYVSYDRSEMTRFLANCNRRTYLPLDSYVASSTTDAVRIIPHPVIYQSFVNSAMDHALDLICGRKR
jgi:hypothetical protein